MHVPDQIAAGDCERDQGKKNTRRGGAYLRGIQVDIGNYQAPCGRVCDLKSFLCLVLACSNSILSTMGIFSKLKPRFAVEGIVLAVSRFSFIMLSYCIMCFVLLQCEYLDFWQILADGVLRLGNTV